MLISELTHAPQDPILVLINKAVQHFGAENLMGGNCGQFALAVAQVMAKQGVQLPLAVICGDSFGEMDDVSPEDILQADVPVYHVAINVKPYFYDADGKITGSHIQKWVKKEYGDPAPALFIFDLTEPGLGALIRSETAWSISAHEFEKFLAQQLTEGAYKGGLRKWFRQKWVDVSRKVDGKHPACGASAGKQGRSKDPQRAYPKCVPAGKAAKMTAKQKKSATARKRRAERKPGAAGKVDWVKT